MRMSLRSRHYTSRTGPLVAILSLTGVTVSVMQTLVIPLMPHLPRILDAAADDATWVLTVTLMVGAVSTPIAGRLADMVGKRRMLLLTLGFMIAGSVLCALSSSLAPMLVGRALQGVGVSALALGISLMRDVLPAHRLGSAVALMSATLGIGGAVGLPASAIVAQHLSWHCLFVGSAALGIIAVAAIAILVPETEERSGGGFDFAGALVLSAVLLLVLFAFTKTQTWGWLDPGVLGGFAGAALLLLAFVRVERRTPHPLVDLAVTSRPAVRNINLASIAVGFAFYSCNLVVTQLLQAPTATGYGLGQSMVVAGVCAAPMGFLMMLMSPYAARVIQQRGPRMAFMVGISIVAVGFMVGVFFLDGIWQAVLLTMLVGSGVALAYAAAPAIILRSVPVSQTGAASSVNQLSHAIGTSLASAVHGGILATAFVPGGTQYGPLNPFQLCFALAVAGCLLAFVFAWRIPDVPALAPTVQPPAALISTETDSPLTESPLAESPLTDPPLTDPPRAAAVPVMRRAPRTPRRPAARRRPSARPADRRPTA